MKLRTYARLGLTNIARVLAYRLALKSGKHAVQQLNAPSAAPPFFRASEWQGDLPPANMAWDNSLWWFGWFRQPLPNAPPDWFANPFSGAQQPNATLDWWLVPDFAADDIKGLWELSRFDWVVAWATKAANSDADALNRLNTWLADWSTANPPYKGPNWKCGQEASIRVMHLVTAALVLGQDRRPNQGFVDLLIVHLQRIAPTMSYAIGQQNNHGTSEAAALFIGGSLLLGYHPRAETWARKGRRWLEERAASLIRPDGSFSQYSVTYHRLLLDTYALAEIWRRNRSLPRFSDELHGRLAAATEWLWTLVDPETGDAPNIGANDGARLLQVVGCDYRDFRPSVQLAAALFNDADAFGQGPWTALLAWFKVADGNYSLKSQSKSFDDGGYHVLRVDRTLGVMRYPRFRFRPSQADALHVDLWHSGINLLRDAGTFSYNADQSEWFASTAAHNTIEFDGRDQMPRLGRFLFGGWLNAEKVQQVRTKGKSATGAAGYTDAKRVRHHRTITLTGDSFVCEDRVSGPFQEACLRWRLVPGPWRLAENIMSDGKHTIAFYVDGQPVAPTIALAIESRYYQHHCEVPIASVRVNRAAKLITKVTF
jgi:hypothetical protein